MTGQRGQLGPFTYIDMVITAGADTGNTGGGAITLSPDAISRLSIQSVWTGTAAGTLLVEASNGPEARPLGTGDNVTWSDVTSIFALTDPTTGGGDEIVTFENVNYGFIRISLTSSTGTGTYKLQLAGRY